VQRVAVDGLGVADGRDEEGNGEFAGGGHGEWVGRDCG
jgi:hypothetical protein